MQNRKWSRVCDLSLKSLAMIFAVATLSANHSLADARVTSLRMREPIDGESGRVTSNGEFVWDGARGYARALVELEFFGFQKNTDPNEQRRLFWLQVGVAPRTEQLNGGEGAPDWMEVSLIPYTTSKLRVPQTLGKDALEIYGAESHQQWGSVTLFRDRTNNIEKGLRFRPYRYLRAGRGVDGNYYLSAELLGYSIEQQITKSGKEFVNQLLHVASAEGGLRFVIHETDRTRFLFDIALGLGTSVALISHGEAPTHFGKAMAKTGFGFDLYKSDLQRRLGEFRFDVSGSGEFGAAPWLDENGKSIPHEERLGNDADGAFYMGGSFTFYLD